MTDIKLYPEPREGNVMTIRYEPLATLPLVNSRLDELVEECANVMNLGEGQKASLRDFLQVAAREGYKIGHEEGYQCATEFVASGEECPHRA